ncbi:acetyl-CoA synthetase-like protein [Eremomyces bilateralis CBS 781.70]|uniref:Acetyl-CoA synthetase-like protein n=1 Tax=Eremomyces bilateralis CBS 781.70 TaxID=1392243 RepID=A0A6G1FYG3_9PEZI|nr:acetyl-CoA synthetase-like protein [Eremomyces bilateralis CBS 781.70]KAF1810609.1 acetyl-CoA synthetase-like protein [Eremomyces bilateralis CBS 781.70]
MSITTDIVSWTFGGEGGLSDPDKPILIDTADTTRALSHAQIKSYVRRLVAGLRAIGVAPGDCVCVNSFNDILYYAIYLGAIGTGARWTGVNPSYTAHELTHHMSMTEAKVLIVEPALLTTTLEAAKECGISESKIFVFDVHDENTHPHLQSWDVLLQHGEEDWVMVDDPYTTTATYASTSGTSGLPKAAFLPHSYLVSQAERRLYPKVPYEVQRLTPLPPFHVFATPLVPSSIHAGWPIYIMRRFDMAAFITSISKFAISETYAPPPVLLGVPQSPLCTKESLSTLRQIWTGGAGVKYENQLPFYEKLHPDAQINQVWGMTEAGWVTCVQWGEKSEDDSVGRPVEGFEIQIMPESGDLVTTDDTPGDILVRSRSLMLGYIQNPTATADAFYSPQDDSSHPWLKTGDWGFLRHGRVFIVDRRKDLIKVRGWQVSPAEVEGTLLTHPAVLDAAVVGVQLPDAVAEHARAYVVVRPGQEVSGDEVRKWVGKMLARYKVPEEVVFIDKIPKNSTGKILRRLLRTQDVPVGSVAAESGDHTVHKRDRGAVVVDERAGDESSSSSGSGSGDEDLERGEGKGGEEKIRAGTLARVKGSVVGVLRAVLARLKGLWARLFKS